MSDVRKQIIEVAKRLHAKNMLAAADGNLSVRTSYRRILITPSGSVKAFVRPQEISELDLDGKILRGRPSGEREMHLAVYRTCPKARAVIHAHPPYAIAWSNAFPKLKELPSQSMSEVILAVGKIPVVPYARPGTKAMGEGLKPFLPQCRVMILARHGALAWGESLEEAYRGMERLEHSALILKIAHELGGLTRLPRSEVQYLQNLRAKMGEIIL